VEKRGEIEGRGKQILRCAQDDKGEIFVRSESEDCWSFFCSVKDGAGGKVMQAVDFEWFKWISALCVEFGAAQLV
jgi:hypothetical protein